MANLLNYITEQMAKAGNDPSPRLTLQRSVLIEAYRSKELYQAINLASRGLFHVDLPLLLGNLQMQECFSLYPLATFPWSERISLKKPVITFYEDRDEVMCDLVEVSIPLMHSIQNSFIEKPPLSVIDENLCIACAVFSSWVRAENEIHLQVLNHLLQVSRRPELSVDIPEMSLPRPSILCLIHYMSMVEPWYESYPDGDRTQVILIPRNYRAGIGLVEAAANPKAITEYPESTILLPYSPESDYAPMMRFWRFSLRFYMNKEVRFRITRKYDEGGIYAECHIPYAFYFEEEHMKVIPEIQQAIKKLAS